MSKLLPPTCRKAEHLNLSQGQIMEELFEIPQSKSPRLQWMHRHWIRLEEKDGKHRAVQGLVNFAYRDTEDMALTHAAQMLGIRLWNEETLTDKPQ